MRIVVTGSSGHLGEGLIRLLARQGRPVLGIDRRAGPFTGAVGSIADAGFVREALAGADAVLHCATLHKPHVATHAMQDFIDVNVTGTRVLLEAAVAAGVGRFVFTSTTSAFGAALRPGPGEPAAWIDETVRPVSRNIYGATKLAAEDLCLLVSRAHGLRCTVLRVSRFFPEPDDDPVRRASLNDRDLKAGEFLHRRVDLEDAATAHLLALERQGPGFARYVVSAPTPFRREDMAELRRDPEAVVARRVPGFARVRASQGLRLPPDIDRVYDSGLAQRELGWTPVHHFGHVLGQIEAGAPIGSALARAVGRKGYHGEAWRDGLYPVA